MLGHRRVHIPVRSRIAPISPGLTGDALLKDVVRKDVCLGVDVGGFVTVLEGICADYGGGGDGHAGAGRGVGIRRVYPRAIERTGSGDGAVGSVDDACPGGSGGNHDGLRGVEESTIDGEPGVCYETLQRT